MSTRSRNRGQIFEQGRMGRLENQVRENWFAYALFAPTLVFLFLVLWLPFLRGISLSLYNWTFAEPPSFIGLENYIELYNWPIFWNAVEVTFLYVTVTFVQIALGLFAALLIANSNHFKNLLSGVFLTSYTMPGVVTGTIWLFLANPNIGPLFKFLTDWGLLQNPIYWSTDGTLSLAVIWLVGAWTFWPFAFLILIASRESIPEEYYESAKVYGANRLQMFWKVTLPQMKTALIIVLSLRFVFNLSKISQPLAITGGGPGWSTSLMAILMYRLAWARGEMGIAFAVGLILFLMAVIPIVIFVNKTEEEDIA